MSFNLGLDVLLSVGDQSNELRRHLIQAFMDYGCSTDDLDNLLRDCRERRELLNGLAKKVAGPIWEQAEVSVSLEVDFAISFRDFWRQHPEVRISSGAREDCDSAWVGKEPRGACKYQLAHFEELMSFNGILEANFGQKVEYAGFRELVVYASLLPLDVLSHFAIVAPGSLLCHEMQLPKAQRVTGKTFPFASAGSLAMQVGYYSVRDACRREYATNNFFLVRVYE